MTRPGVRPMSRPSRLTDKPDKPKNTGQFGKGNPGKPKGAVNKVTRDLKEMILGALETKGGQKWLEAQMDENPSAFLTLLGKIVPKDVMVEVREGLAEAIRKARERVNRGK